MNRSGVERLGQSSARFRQRGQERRQAFQNDAEEANGYRFGVGSLGGVSFFLEPGNDGGPSVRVRFRLMQKHFSSIQVRKEKIGQIKLHNFSADKLVNDRLSEIVQSAKSLEELKRAALPLVVTGLDVLHQLTKLVFPSGGAASSTPTPADVDVE